MSELESEFMAAELSGGLQAALGQLLKEEQAREGKKKPAFKVPVEKRLQYYSGWSKKGKGVSKMDEEIGRIKKSDTTEIVIRVDEFGGKMLLFAQPASVLVNELIFSLPSVS